MAEVAIRLEEKNEGSNGFEYLTEGVVIFSSKINKSCDMCLRAKRRCDRKLPCRYDGIRMSGTRRLSVMIGSPSGRVLELVILVRS